MLKAMSVVTSFLIILILTLISFTILIDDPSPISTDGWEEENGHNLVSDEVDSSEDNVTETESGNENTVGLHTNKEELQSRFGEPDQIFWTPYGYDWWLFEEDESPHLFGLQNGNVVTKMIFKYGASMNGISIGDSYESVNDDFDFQDELDLGGVMTSYVFELTEDDMLTKPLVILESGDYAQLYFDKFDGTLTAIRKQTEDVLLTQRPYSLSYRGSLIEPEELSGGDMEKWQEGQEELIHLISNHFRDQKGLYALEKAEDVRSTARAHSRDMYSNGFFAHDSPNTGSLGDRLNEDDVNFQGAAENIAAHYIDSLEVVNGWLNSEGHRVNLLSEDFTYVASGVYDYYYTQNFINYR